MGLRRAAPGAAALLAACMPMEAPPRPPLADTPPIDAAYDGHFPVTMPMDASFDAPGTTTMDAPLADGEIAPPDAGALEIAVDGVLGDSDWSRATTSTTTVAASTPFDGCALREMLLLAGATHFFLGVRGEIALCSGAGLVVYVDAAPGDGVGMLLMGSVGPDTTGALDRVLSTPLTATDASIRPDYAWGSLTMPAGIGGSRAEVGWRLVGGTSYAPTGSQTTACSASECETSVSYAALGLARGRTYNFAVFARMGNGTDWASPTLPPDLDPSFVLETTRLAVEIP